jgi:hypothetical protein
MPSFRLAEGGGTRRPRWKVMCWWDYERQLPLPFRFRCQYGPGSEAIRSTLSVQQVGLILST